MSTGWRAGGMVGRVVGKALMMIRQDLRFLVILFGVGHARAGAGWEVRNGARG